MTSNFFAALGDSDDDDAPAPSVPLATKKKVTPKPEVVEPSVVDERKRSDDRHSDRNTKFGRGGRTSPRDGKRAYERRSGTGRGREIKKDGDGARNWGSDKTEARSGEHTNVHSSEETPEDENDRETDANGDTDEGERDNGETDELTERQSYERPRPEVVVDNTISYEDYMKAKSAEGSSGLLAPAKPREVVDEFANIKPAIVEEQDFLVLGGIKPKRKKDSATAEQPVMVNNLLASLRVTPGGGGELGGRFGSGREGGRGSGRRGGGGERSEGRGGGGRDFRGERGAGRGGRDFRGGRGSGRSGPDFRGGRNSRDGGGGREYRGGERGGGRRDSGGRGRGDMINVHDETAFPSL